MWCDTVHVPYNYICREIICCQNFIKVHLCLSIHLRTVWWNVKFQAHWLLLFAIIIFMESTVFCTYINLHCRYLNGICILDVISSKCITSGPRNSVFMYILWWYVGRLQVKFVSVFPLQIPTAAVNWKSWIWNTVEIQLILYYSFRIVMRN